MATDSNDRAWKRLAVSLTDALPGEWTVGRMGTNGVLVRVPVDWTFTWIRPERSRKIDDPRIIVGRVNLVSPFRLGYHYGARSDVFGGPGKVDLTADNAQQTVLDFITAYGLPQVDLWDAIRMAEACEAQYLRPEAEWGRPILFPEAAGWRLVFDTGSPEGPAEQGIAWLRGNYAPDEGDWYAALLEAWRHGGRAAGLDYLTAQREEALRKLKLPKSAYALN